MMLPRSIATLGAVVALLSALTSALPIPQQQTFSLEKRDDAGLDEPLEARLMFWHHSAATKKTTPATCSPPVTTRDVDDLDAREFEDELTERDEAVLEIRDHLNSILEKRDDDHLVLSIRDMADEDLALAIRSAWENMSDVERRGFWSKIKSFGRKVWGGVKKVGRVVSNVASKAGQVVGFASKFLGGTKYGGALNSISKGINTVGSVSGKVAGMRRDYDEFGVDARDVVEEVMDIRSLPDEHLVLIARAALEEMPPFERRDLVNTLARYL